MIEYKDYLDAGTNESLGFNDPDKSRYKSFKFCFDVIRGLWANRVRPNVLELGCVRSFVGGAFDGCNQDRKIFWNSDAPERWDWGAGAFMLVIGQAFSGKADFTSVDINTSHLKRARHMYESLGIECKTVQSDSVKFLSSTKKKYDLIYLDTGDMWPIDDAIELQLQEAHEIYHRKLLNADGLILIDDVLNCTPRKMGAKNELGKSEKSIPYLLSKGFKTVFEGYQYILK